VGEIKVTIYERVKRDGDWTRVPVEIPAGRKRDGRLFLKDDRQGKFQLSWYEKRRKKLQDVTRCCGADCSETNSCRLPVAPHATGEAIDVHRSGWQFRNNVAFHARGRVAAQIMARMNLRDEDTYLDLVSAIHDFQNLMKTLRADELTAVPELPKMLEQLHVNLHPAFAPRRK
jgi:hypothetical protein